MIGMLLIKVALVYGVHKRLIKIFGWVNYGVVSDKTWPIRSGFIELS